VIRSSARGDSPETLPAFLSGEARKASEGELAIAVTFGVLVALVALLWHPHGWAYFFASGLTCGAFGGWGITDRHLGEQAQADSGAAWVLRLARFACGSVGAAAGVALVLLVLFIFLGTWIS
jgi:putative flippase GtrA